MEEITVNEELKVIEKFEKSQERITRNAKKPGLERVAESVEEAMFVT